MRNHDSVILPGGLKTGDSPRSGCATKL
jgi:hypothetical protein